MRMPSLPESGPMRISTLSCSTSRRAEARATSGLLSDEARKSSILMPPISLLNSSRAISRPRKPSLPSSARGPSSVASPPILIGCRGCADAATARPVIAAPVRSASCRLLRVSMGVSSFFLYLTSVLSRLRTDVAGLEGGGAGCAPDQAPHADNSIGREHHDGDEDEADDRVEPLRIHELDGKALHDGKGECADIGADGSPETAHNGCDEHVDDRSNSNRAWRDRGIQPNVQHSAEPGDKAGHTEREHTQGPDWVAQRPQPARFVADCLQRQPERRSHNVADQGKARCCDGEAQVVEGSRPFERNAEHSGCGHLREAVE